jgi:hypothetical protein
MQGGLIPAAALLLGTESGVGPMLTVGRRERSLTSSALRYLDRSQLVPQSQHKKK